MAEFVIDRSRWRCGNNGKYQAGYGDTLLLNHEGYMCCLGQVSKQCGLKNKDILELGTPQDIYKPLPLLQSQYKKDGCSIRDNVLSTNAIRINDSSNFSHETREKKLVKLFKKHGHTITFKGKYKNTLREQCMEYNSTNILV